MLKFLFAQTIIFWKRIFIARLTEEWSDKNRNEVAVTLSPILGIDLETMQKTINRKNFGITPITEELITLQQEVVDKFSELQLIPKQINVKEVMLTHEQYAAFSPKTQ